MKRCTGIGRRPDSGRLFAPSGELFAPDPASGPVPKQFPGSHPGGDLTAPHSPPS